MATLVMGARQGHAVNKQSDGVWSIDKKYLPSGPAQVVYVAPGRRKIGYNCPGFLFMDNPPTLEHNFEAGKLYEIVCDGERAIRLLRDGA